MKNTVDYMVGNTAIQIVNKGNKIKIVDVEKQEKKRKFRKKCLVSLMTGFVVFASCMYVVNLQNRKVFLDKQVYSLQTEIDELEKENKMLVREEEQETIDYAEILKKAKAMGMDFPKENQICHYKVDKSTAVRINSSVFSKE